MFTGHFAVCNVVRVEFHGISAEMTTVNVCVSGYYIKVLSILLSFLVVSCLAQKKWILKAILRCESRPGRVMTSQPFQALLGSLSTTTTLSTHDKQLLGWGWTATGLDYQPLFEKWAHALPSTRNARHPCQSNHSSLLGEEQDRTRKCEKNLDYGGSAGTRPKSTSAKARVEYRL